MASGMAPSWFGSVTPWAMISPFASQMRRRKVHRALDGLGVRRADTASDICSQIASERFADQLAGRSRPASLLDRTRHALDLDHDVAQDVAARRCSQVARRPSRRTPRRPAGPAAARRSGASRRSTGVVADAVLRAEVCARRCCGAGTAAARRRRARAAAQPVARHATHDAQVDDLASGCRCGGRRSARARPRTPLRARQPGRLQLAVRGSDIGSSNAWPT